MNKTLLFIAILAFSINVFAQNKWPAHSMQHATPNSMANILHNIEAAGMKTTAMFFKDKFKYDYEHQAPFLGSSPQKNDSIYNWEWDTNLAGWKRSLKIINIVYDDNNNNVLSELGKKWTGSAWVDSLQNTYTYNAENHLSSLISKNWSGNSWVNAEQIIFTYDANNNNLSFAIQTWNGSGWDNLMKLNFAYDANDNTTSELWQFGSLTVWENFMQSIYTYDANNNQISQTDQMWNDTSAFWDFTSKSTWAYNVSNNKTSELVENWTGSAWETLYKITYSYDASNNLTVGLEQLPDGNLWLDYVKTTYTYDPNNNLIKELQQINILSWQDASQKIYTYDANKNTTSKLQQAWNGSAWLTEAQYLSTFDANNFETGNSFKGWNIDRTQIDVGDSTHYYFHTGVTGIPGLRSENFIVYPNPSKGKLTISSNSTISAIEIYNLNGKHIYSDYNIKRQTSKEIDLTGYAKGIYFIKIYNGTKYYNRKVIVQ